VTDLHVRPIFSQTTLARLSYDEPVSMCDSDTGIEVFYRFEDSLGGRLRLTGGPLGKQVIAVGCNPDDINTVASLLIDGIRFQMR
jgi:hypothetical protein